MHLNDKFYNIYFHSSVIYHYLITMISKTIIDGKYLIEQFLGKGAFGEIYSGILTDPITKTTQNVAIKMVII